MRKLSPAHLAIPVLAAMLAGIDAQAQVTVRQGAATGTAGSTATTNTSPRAVAGGCAGTAGSTCAANTTSTASPATTGAAAADPVSPPTETVPGLAGGNVRSSGTASAGATGNAAVNPSSASANNNSEIFTTGDASLGAFRLTPNTPDATPTGAALGRSPGQTSAGTAAGASSPGIAAGSENLGTVTGEAATTGFASGAVVPGVALAGGVGVAADGGITANGERVGSGGAGAATVVAGNAATPTPTFNMVAREGAAREARRRARGEEPRVYGIAPRTERDLTHQMPDDPIIRY